jgi:hypothetical protein
MDPKGLLSHETNFMYVCSSLQRMWVSKRDSVVTNSVQQTALIIKWPYQRKYWITYIMSRTGGGGGSVT